MNLSAPRWLSAFAAACLCISPVQPLVCNAQTSPFVIPPNGPVRGSAVDQSSINGPIERIVRNGGHFELRDSKRRIRFFGLNIAGPDLFAANQVQIEAAARRLAAMGCNVVRLHHLDNMWGKANHESLWNSDSEALTIDRKQLTKLHFAIDRFEKNGIYVNLNLKVSKELGQADGLPAKIDTGLFVHQKRVDRFYPPFIEHQRRFARAMLETVNPLNQLAPKDDPGVAFVEINNENSIMSLWPGQVMGKDLDKLPQPYVAYLQSQWNRWLQQKYGSDERLLTAWSADSEPPGASVVESGKEWFLNQMNGAKAELTSQPSQVNGVLPEAAVQIQHQTGTDWHVQLIHPAIDLKDGRRYSVMFECRSDQPGELRVSSARDHDDYRNVGLSEALRTSSDWTKHEFTFVAKSPEPKHSQLLFHLGLLHDIELRGVRMIEGNSKPVVAPGTSLAQGSLPIATTSHAIANRDWIDFLAELDRSYSDEFRQFLRDELHVQSLICDSQVQWGGTTGYYREMGSDFIDTHAYWEHPEFEGGSWNPNHWKVQRRSQIAAWASGELTALGSLARARQFGKPFVISEYDHPSVNDFQVEMIPMVASLGCVQDWDALYQFCHGPIADRLDRTTGYFDQTGNPAKFAFYPSMSRMFRKELLSPASEPLTRTAPMGIWHQAPNASDLWKSENTSVAEILSHRVRVMVPEDRASHQDDSAKRETSGNDPSGKIELTTDRQGAIWAASSPFAAVWSGFIGNQTFKSEAVSLQVGALPDQFGSVTLVTLDDQPISQSRRMLLTAAGRSENVGMGWNEDRTSVGSQWGEGPVHIATVTAAVTVAANAANKVYALNSRGERVQEIAVRQRDGNMVFDISPVHQTVWYEIAE